jgi:hypothetical protein
VLLRKDYASRKDDVGHDKAPGRRRPKQGVEDGQDHPRRRSVAREEERAMAVLEDYERTPVVDAEIFWLTEHRKGVFKLQHNSDPILTDYNYRIVQEGHIVASGDREEILKDWAYFTGEQE